MGRVLTFLAWLPFGIAGNPGLWTLIVLFVGFNDFPHLPHAVLAMLTIGAVSRMIALKIRPPKRGHPRNQVIASSAVRLAVRMRGCAASARRIRCTLAPELRTLLAGPTDRQPEAILHEQRQAKQAQLTTAN